MIVSTGFFDGVHSGHRLVIDRLVSLSRERGDEPLVVTFWPHPRTVFQDGARDLRLLTSLEEKKALLAGLGVDRVEVLPFSREFAALTAEQYLRDVLQERFGAAAIVVGYDNRIGSDRLMAEQLAPVAGALGMDTVVCPSLREGEGCISSTRIRKVLSEGDVALAAGMLGYRYSLVGVVVAGNRMGRTIGFPTANIQLYEPLKMVPKNGVYLVEVEVLGSRFRGMCNIGMRPTVGGTSRSIETHIFHFSRDIYGLPLKIRFVRRLRDERKFPSLEALRVQLEADKVSLLKEVLNSEK